MTSLVVTGSRLEEIRRTVFHKNTLGHEGSTQGHKLVIGTPVSPADGGHCNLCGARHYLSRSEGSGYWDMMHITDGLLLSIADAQYREAIEAHLPVRARRQITPTQSWRAACQKYRRSRAKCQRSH